MADRVSFTVQGADHLDLQSRAIECLSEFFDRDVTTTEPQVRWTLSATPLVVDHGTGKIALWEGDVEASVHDQGPGA